MSKDLFQNYFESAPDYVLQVDATGRILAINRTYRGLSIEDVIGSSVFDWVPEEFRSGVKNSLERVLRTGEHEVIEYWTVNTDGEKRWHSAHFGLILGGSGNRTAIAIVRDITPRIEAEEALQESEKRYRSLFDECPIALWEVDASRTRAYLDDLAERGVHDFGDYFGKHPEEAVRCIDLLQVVDANKAALDLYEADSKQAFLSDVGKILVDSPYDAIKEELMAITKGASLFEREAVHQTFRGVRKHVLSRFSVAPGYQKSFGKILVSVIDLTEHRKVQEELEKVQRLESLGVLAGGIAHDFNNLLTAILANLSMARLYGDPKEDIAEMLADAEKASLRAKRLTQQLLAFSRGGSPKKKTLSIERVIRETTDFALSGSRVQRTFSLPRDLWPVEADEGQIAQVVQNLVINADQAMPGGGTLAVSVRNVILGDKDLPLGKGGRYVQISFADQGTGIADKHLPKIFDPFFTTKQKGSGLGLSTSFSIVKNHGGQIQVESQVGVGTTFHVYLPASDKTLHPEKVKDKRRVAFNGKILLIDDEPIIRRSAGEVLRRLGFEVESAKDGSEGIRLHEKAVKAERPFDAVIMDLTIPGGMDGKETVRELKRIDPAVKVVVSSGYSNDAVLARYRDYGFAAAVPKPWSIEELADTLGRVIGSARG